ncbi:MAG: hypothetical protein HC897_10455, partial [Thermoanaerobaculia bacterium]|nr:hypothetical protein [Thermoanaerobaculia bacterium]
LPDGTNRDAVGARVIARIGTASLLREVALGDGYGSQNALRLYFGLGDATQVDELTIVWPRSGRRQVFQNVAANRIVAVAEGKDELIEKVYATPGAGGEADAVSQVD